MDFGIEGKVAMVAAASKGIGLATAKALTEEGCVVSICGRTEATLEAAAAEIGGETRPYVVDVSSSEDLDWWYRQTLEDLGPVDILVTNTGGPAAGNVFELTDEQWLEGVQSTLMNVVRLTRMVKNSMAERQWGRIVHITSYVAKEPSTVLPISTTLRSGLMGLTKVQAAELGEFGITVNSVLPGSTLTDRILHLADIRAEKMGITQEEALQKQAQESAVKRIADPSEIGATIAFLCSQQAAYITGTSILVDGGLAKGIG
ncbi:MAG TPA: SDR family oxidoreductase [Verrucomicrobiae bacterium]|nr:SDR family oxidoreductase [Verrucomicrobiae bacterium]HWD38818.1 SDR family oxidoreductase [Fimbriimonas sp.]